MLVVGGGGEDCGKRGEWFEDIGLEGRNTHVPGDGACKFAKLHSLGTEIGGGGAVSQKRTLATDEGNATMEHTNLAVMTDAPARWRTIRNLGPEA